MDYIRLISWAILSANLGPVEEILLEAIFRMRLRSGLTVQIVLGVLNAIILEPQVVDPPVDLAA